MAPPKNKKTLSLAELSALIQSETVKTPASGASWADEEVELPSGPMAASALPSGPAALGGERPIGRFEPTQRGAGREGRGSAGRQEPPPPTVIDHARLPTKAPFLCFMGNLSFEVTEADIREFFAGLLVKDVRIPVDHQTRRPRGFAIVEFGSSEALVKGLMIHGQMLKGRYPRMDITEGRPSESNSPFASAGNWRDNPHRVNESSSRAPAPSPSSGFSPAAPVPTRAAPMDWRSTAKPVEAAPVAPKVEAPAAFVSKKPEIKLQPRTKPVEDQAASDIAPEYRKAKSNPFGSARPREVVLGSKEAAVEPESK